MWKSLRMLVWVAVQFVMVNSTPSSCLLFSQDPASPNDADRSSKPWLEIPAVATPPITTVLLYDSGLAQYQHSGKVDGDARVHMSFPVEEINDVLKSLVFSDAGNGRVRMIEMRSNENDLSATERLYEQPLTLAQLLQTFRGHRVSAAGPDGVLQGAIVGVETRTTGDQTFEVIVLLQDNTLHWLRLSDVQQIQMNDPELNEQLSAALARLTENAAQVTKGLDLVFEGEGSRELSFAYVVGAPVWRMSYRLVVESDSVVLQGWAHIDNTTTSDWDQITLELRSGHPDAFRAPMLRPVFNPRPLLGIEVFGLDESKSFLGGAPYFGQATANELTRTRVLGSGRGFGGGAMGGGGAFGFELAQTVVEPDEAQTMDIESAFSAMSDPSQVAEMVRFHIREPISLAAGRSAVVPVFNRPFPARRISRFDASVSNGLPIRMLEITNDSEWSLIPGPVSMHEQGRFIGDAAMPRITVGEKTYFRLGLDEFLHVDRGASVIERSPRKVVRIGSELVLTEVETSTTTLTIENRQAEPRIVMATNSLESGFQHQFPTGATVTAESVTVETEAAGNSTSKITFIASHTTENKTPLAAVTLQSIPDFLTGANELDAATRTVLENYRELLHQQAEFVEAVNVLVARRTGFLEHQDAVRKNIAAVGGDNEAATPFIEKLLRLESEIEAIDREITTAMQSRDDQKVTLQQFLSGLAKE